jgi:hypothetical protein
MTKPKVKPSVTTNTNLQILASLHETMKQIRQAKWDREGVDPKLCRIYAEAVEQYIHAKPQQQLLKEYANGNPRTGKAAGD